MSTESKLCTCKVSIQTNLQRNTSVCLFVCLWLRWSLTPLTYDYIFYFNVWHYDRKSTKETRRLAEVSGGGGQALVQSAKKTREHLNRISRGIQLRQAGKYTSRRGPYISPLYDWRRDLLSLLRRRQTQQKTTAMKLPVCSPRWRCKSWVCLTAKVSMSGRYHEAHGNNFFNNHFFFENQVLSCNVDFHLTPWNRADC